jgi:hypothetical protein
VLISTATLCYLYDTRPGTVGKPVTPISITAIEAFSKFKPMVARLQSSLRRINRRKGKRGFTFLGNSDGGVNLGILAAIVLPD